MPARAIYAGTFDPVHKGHLDIIERCYDLFGADRFHVLVAAEGKQTTFTLEKRLDLLRECSVYCAESFTGLLVDNARRLGATVLVRGVRSYQDWEYELQMLRTNRVLCPYIETIFLAPSEEHAFISSTMVRQIASLGGEVLPFVPAAVSCALEGKYPRTRP